MFEKINVWEYHGEMGPIFADFMAYDFMALWAYNFSHFLNETVMKPDVSSIVTGDGAHIG